METAENAETTETVEASALADTTDGAQSYTCPRCSTSVTAIYYGPCSTCIDELRATVGGEARDVAATAYEPKMNVTPNAVASKE